MRLFLLTAFLFSIASAFTTPTSTTTTASRLSSFQLFQATDDHSQHHVDGASGSGKKKVIVLGGDGFCGWPTSLYLSDQGHDVVIVDNLSRRNIDNELGCDSLTPIQSPEVRYCMYC